MKKTLSIILAIVFLFSLGNVASAKTITRKSVKTTVAKVVPKTKVVAVKKSVKKVAKKPTKKVVAKKKSYTSKLLDAPLIDPNNPPGGR